MKQAVTLFVALIVGTFGAGLGCSKDVPTPPAGEKFVETDLGTPASAPSPVTEVGKPARDNAVEDQTGKAQPAKVELKAEPGRQFVITGMKASMNGGPSATVDVGNVKVEQPAKPQGN